jgi:hypothetical protein
MIFIFLSIVIFGIIIFFATIIFYRTSNLSNKGTIVEKRDADEGGDTAEGETEDYYVPVIKPDRSIPGLGKNEVVHYFGSCELFSLETLLNPDQLTLDKDELSPEIEGEIALTSKNILIFDAQHVKRIYISSIENYHFFDPYLIIKRRNVKRKKDVVKLEEERSSFKYILHALM